MAVLLSSVDWLGAPDRTALQNAELRRWRSETMKFVQIAKWFIFLLGVAWTFFSGNAFLFLAKRFHRLAQ